MTGGGVGDDYDNFHQAKTKAAGGAFEGLTNNSGIPHHKVTKVLAGLEGCITTQDVSQAETKDGAKEKGIVKRDQAKAKGGDKKEDNDNRDVKVQGEGAGLQGRGS